MTERDDELGRILGELPVPEHGPGFWDRLDAGLAAQGVPRPVDGGGAEEPAATPVGDTPTSTSGAARGVTPLPTAARRRDAAPAVAGGGRARWLAAAAALVVAAGGVAAWQALDQPDGGDVISVAADGDGRGGTAPSTTTSSVDPSRIAETEPLGPGLVVAALAADDGSPTVLVRDVLPGDEVGCEGQPLEGLLVLGPDGSTTPVPGPGGGPVSGGVDVVSAPAGDRVAIVARCEGFLSQLLVGRIGADGVPTELELVAGHTDGGTPVPGAPSVSQAPSVAWSADGATLLVTTVDLEAGGPERALWAYDAAAGAWTVRPDAPEGVLAAVERADGVLVAVTEAGLVVGDLLLEDSTEHHGLALAPDGRTAAAFGGQGLRLISAQDRWLVPEGPVLDARFTPDGRSVVYTTVDEGADPQVVLRSVPVAGGEPAELGRSQWGWFRVLPDGSGLLVAVDGPADGEGFARPAVERWRFAAG